MPERLVFIVLILILLFVPSLLSQECPEIYVPPYGAKPRECERSIGSTCLITCPGRRICNFKIQLKVWGSNNLLLFQMNLRSLATAFARVFSRMKPPNCSMTMRTWRRTVKKESQDRFCLAWNQSVSASYLPVQSTRGSVLVKGRPAAIRRNVNREKRSPNWFVPAKPKAKTIVILKRVLVRVCPNTTFCRRSRKRWGIKKCKFLADKTLRTGPALSLIALVSKSNFKIWPIIQEEFPVGT